MTQKMTDGKLHKQHWAQYKCRECKTIIQIVKISEEFYSRIECESKWENTFMAILIVI